jgi:hypothetical protein
VQTILRHWDYRLDGHHPLCEYHRDRAAVRVLERRFNLSGRLFFCRFLCAECADKES